MQSNGGRVLTWQAGPYLSLQLRWRVRRRSVRTPRVLGQRQWPIPRATPTFTPRQQMNCKWSAQCCASFEVWYVGVQQYNFSGGRGVGARDVLEGGGRGGGLRGEGAGGAGTPLPPEFPYGLRRRRAKPFEA